MEKLLEILKKIKPGTDFERAGNLIDSGVLDSFAIITLVAELNDEFDIEITVRDIVPENFNSLDAIMKMIERLQDED